MSIEYGPTLGVVTITRGRWDVRIEIQPADPDEEKAVFVASADSGVTHQDHIWFGTPDEMRQELT